MENRVSKLIVIPFLLLVYFNSQAKPVSETINPCSSVFEYKGLAYFCANQTQTGRELFVSDGRMHGNRLVVNLDDGPGSSSPNGFFEHKGSMFFLAETDTTGWGLYRSDGTAKGTKLIRPFIASHASVFQMLTTNVVARIGDDLYFEIDGIYDRNDPNLQDRVLFKTDGSYSGTVRINVPITSAYLTNGYARARTSYFSLNNQLFVLTSSVLYKVRSPQKHEKIYEFTTGNRNQYFTAVVQEGLFVNGNAVIVVADGDDPDDSPYTNGFSTWLSNGTSNGTRLYRKGVTPLGSTDDFLLVLDSPAGNVGAISNNGTYTSLGVKAISSWGDFLYRARADVTTARFNSKVLFREYIQGSYDGSDPLWVTDGTLQGTHSLGIGRKWLTYNGFIYGTKASDPSILLKSDGSLNAASVIARSSSSTFSNITAAAGIVYALEQGDVSFHPFTSYQNLWAAIGSNNMGIVGKRLAINLSEDEIQTEGQRIFVNTYTRFDRTGLIYHSDGTSVGTYKLMYRYDDGSGPASVVENKRTVMVPIIDLILSNQ